MVIKNIEKWRMAHQAYWNRLKGCKPSNPFKKGNIPWNKKPKNEFVCKYCNKIFYKSSPHKYKFCSCSCKNKYQKGEHLGKPKNGIFKICPICGNQFYTSLCLIWIKTCSKRCGNKLKIGKHFSWNKGTKGICKSNSGSFKKGKRNSPKTEFRKGMIPWNFKGGSSHRSKRYGVYWEKHRLKILERDKNICQICGKKGDNVDHIIPFRISQDNSFSNLQTLCRKCHSKKTGWEIKYYG